MIDQSNRAGKYQIQLTFFRFRNQSTLNAIYDTSRKNRANQHDSIECNLFTGFGLKLIYENQYLIFTT